MTGNHTTRGTDGMRRTAIITGLTLALLLAPVAAFASSEGDTSLQMVQSERTQRSLSTLRAKADLNAIAERHARRMRDRAEIFHNRNLADEIDGNWSSAGENVGVGPNVQDIHAAFMGSSSHRRNILGGWNEVGIGAARNDSGEVFIVQVFVQRRSASGNTTAPTKPAASPSKPAPRAPATIAPPSAPAPAKVPARSTTEHKPAAARMPQPSSDGSSQTAPAQPAPSRAVGLLLRVTMFEG